MTRRPTAVAVSTALLAAVLAGSSSGASATPAPTQNELDDAAAGVARAQDDLTGAQRAAEAAAEAYNGAQVAADQAAQRSATAAQASATAAQQATDAQAVADRAQAAAAAATAASQQAREESDRAQAAVVVAQAALDGLVAGAYKSGGDLAFYSAMLDADPVTFATGKEMINRVGERSRARLDDLERAKQAATAAADRAAAAERDASDTARAATTTAQAAVAASQAAQQAAQQAATAAAQARATADAAAAAKQHALVLVAAAEATLGSASARSADLQAKAEQARREAAAARAAAEAAARAAAEKARRTGTVAPPATTLASGSVKDVIDAAYAQIGTPYAWGGGNSSGPTRGFAQGADTVGFDCSGLTLYAYAQIGVRLDHYTHSQWDAGRHVAESDLRPGDLVFFAYDTSDPSTIHHVGLYVGNGKMIEAPHTGDVVKVSNYRRSSYIGAVRLVE